MAERKIISIENCLRIILLRDQYCGAICSCFNGRSTNDWNWNVSRFPQLTWRCIALQEQIHFIVYLNSLILSFPMNIEYTIDNDFNHDTNIPEFPWFNFAAMNNHLFNCSQCWTQLYSEQEWNKYWM